MNYTNTPINKIGKVVTGKTPSTSISEYYDGDIMFITPTELHSDYVVTKSEKTISQKGFDSIRSNTISGTSVMVGCIGWDMGNVAVCKETCATNQQINSVTDIAPEYNPMYLYYWLKTKKEYLFSIASVTRTPILSKSTFEEVLVPVPSKKVQDAVSNVLTSIDKKIASNSHINDNLQQQAFSAFDNLIANAENNDYTVSDYAFLNPKRTLAKNQVARSIDMSQLSTSGAFPSGWEMKPFNGGMRFTNGDTLLARITPCLENGKTAFIDFLDDGEVAFGSTEYIVLAPKNDTPPEMLYCLARYPAFVDYAVKNMNGSSGRQRVSAETVG